MRSYLFLYLLMSAFAMADTPPPGTVKAKTYTGDGNTAITATGSSLNVNVTNSSDHSTVDQGDAGSESWLVAVTSSALPTNACVETGGHLASIDSKLTAPLAVSGTFWQTTQPVSGTVTSTITSEGVPDSPAPSKAIQIGGNDYAGDLQVIKVSSGGVLSVDGSASTQPVSGTVTVNQGTPGIGAWPVVAVQAGSWTVAGTGTFTVDGSGHTQPVSAAALPLPSGASTSALQSTINTTLGSPFQAGGSIGNSSFGISGTLPAFAATPTFNLGTLNGAATAANQGTEITSLSSIDTKTPSLGQALAAGSVPVVLTASQLSTLTPLSSVTVSGTVTANAGTGTFTVDGSGHTQPASLATLPSLVAGTAIIGKVGIDQTTPGTTNGVQVNAALPAGSNVIGHVIVDTAPTTAVTQSGTWTVNAKPTTPTAATVRQAVVTIGTSAVRLTTDGLVPPSTRVLLAAQLITGSTAACYFGSSSVTSSGSARGVQMFAGQTLSFTQDAGDYYAICDTSSQTFYVTEQE